MSDAIDIRRLKLLPVELFFEYLLNLIVQSLVSVSVDREKLCGWGINSIKARECTVHLVQCTCSLQLMSLYVI